MGGKMIELLAIFATALRSLVFGFTPDWHSADAVRAWLRHLVGIIAQIAEVTSTAADNALVALIGGLIEDDATWQLLYRLIEADALAPPGITLADRNDTEAALVALVSAPSDTPNISTVDPLTIISMISAVIELIRQIRQHRAKPA